MMHDGILQTFRFEAGEDEDEIVVEVGILIQLLQFLMRESQENNDFNRQQRKKRSGLRPQMCINMCTHTHTQKTLI